MTTLANDKLRLIVTGKCNLSCFYCHNEGQAKEETFLAEGLVERVLSAVRADGMKVREVTISGGEPLLHPQLAGFVRQARELAPDVTVVSNGLLANDELIGRVASAGLSKLRLGAWVCMCSAGGDRQRSSVLTVGGGRGRRGRRGVAGGREGSGRLLGPD